MCFIIYGFSVILPKTDFKTSEWDIVDHKNALTLNQFKRCHSYLN